MGRIRHKKNVKCSYIFDIIEVGKLIPNKGGGEMRITDTEDVRELQEEKRVINLAEEFNCPRQSEKYNKNYRKWRETEGNPYAFQFVCDLKEHTYVDGEGFLELSPSKAERSVLEKFSFLLGVILVFYFTIEIFGEGLLCWIFRLFGADMNWSITGGLVGGTEFFRSCSEIIIGLLKRILPAIIFFKITKFPLSSAFPITIADKNANRSAPACAMILVVVCNFLNQLYMNVLNLVGISDLSGRYYFPESLTLQLIMAFYDVIVVSVVSEFCYRGMIMQPLRQFGDDFALIATSLLASLMCHDVALCCETFVMSVCIGYFVLNTGSIFTGIGMRIIFHAAVYIQELLNFTFPLVIRDVAVSWFRMFLLMAGVCFLVFGKKKQRWNYISFPSSNLTSASFISLKNKFLCLLSSHTIVLWLVMVFVLTLTEIF